MEHPTIPVAKPKRKKNSRSVTAVANRRRNRHERQKRLQRLNQHEITTGSSSSLLSRNMERTIVTVQDFEQTYDNHFHTTVSVDLAFKQLQEERGAHDKVILELLKDDFLKDKIFRRWSSLVFCPCCTVSMLMNTQPLKFVTHMNEQKDDKHVAGCWLLAAICKQATGPTTKTTTTTTTTTRQAETRSVNRLTPPALSDEALIIPVKVIHDEPPPTVWVESRDPRLTGRNSWMGNKGRGSHDTKMSATIRPGYDSAEEEDDHEDQGDSCSQSPMMPPATRRETDLVESRDPRLTGRNSWMGNEGRGSHDTKMTATIRPGYDSAEEEEDHENQDDSCSQSPMMSPATRCENGTDELADEEAEEVNSSMVPLHDLVVQFLAKGVDIDPRSIDPEYKSDFERVGNLVRDNITYFTLEENRVTSAAIVQWNTNKTAIIIHCIVTTGGNHHLVLALTQKMMTNRKRLCVYAYDTSSTTKGFLNEYFQLCLESPPWLGLDGETCFKSNSLLKIDVYPPFTSLRNHPTVNVLNGRELPVSHFQWMSKEQVKLFYFGQEISPLLWSVKDLTFQESILKQIGTNPSGRKGPKIVISPGARRPVVLMKDINVDPGELKASAPCKNPNECIKDSVNHKSIDELHQVLHKVSEGHRACVCLSIVLLLWEIDMATAQRILDRRDDFDGLSIANGDRSIREYLVKTSAWVLHKVPNKPTAETLVEFTPGKYIVALKNSHIGSSHAIGVDCDNLMIRDPSEEGALELNALNLAQCAGTTCVEISACYQLVQKRQRVNHKRKARFQREWCVPK